MTTRRQAIALLGAAAVAPMLPALPEPLAIIPPLASDTVTWIGADFLLPIGALVWFKVDEGHMTLLRKAARNQWVPASPDDNPSDAAGTFVTRNVPARDFHDEPSFQEFYRDDV